MASLEMGRAYDFNEDMISKEVTQEKPGNYALGYRNEEGTFIVEYVGRSDGDVNRRLKEHLDDEKKYRHFKYSYADSIVEAYKKECRNWHDFGGDKGKLDNKNHPDRPDELICVCPICGGGYRK